MVLLDSRNFRPAALVAYALLAVTPFATYFASRSVTTQGTTATFESIGGKVVETGGTLGYTFKVDGKEYTSSRESFLPGHDTLKPRPGLAIGEPVQVYFDPMRPDRCVLKPGTSYSDFALSGFALFGLPAAAVGLWLFARRSNENSANGNVSLRKFESFGPRTLSHRKAA